MLFTSVAVLLFTSVGNLNFALVESDQVTMHVESDEVTMHSAQSLLLHGNVTSDFRSFGTEWIGNTPLLREILSEISLKYPETRNVIHNKSFCYEYEHSLVLSGGRSLPSGTPFGKVPSIYNSSETYRVRTAICDMTKYDVVVEYSMANVRNFETSGLFSSSLLSRMVYVPSLEYEYRPWHQERSMAPITTFNNMNQPRRKALTERLINRGIHVVNRNKIHGRDEMMALYDSTAILINIHQTPHHHTLEEFRVLPALLRGVVVVCESSPLTDAIPYSPFVVWSSYDGLPSRVLEVMSNYDAYFDRFFGPRSELPRTLARMRQAARDGMERRILQLAAGGSSR